MGYSIQRLGAIKAKLVAGDPNDLNNLFEFLEQHAKDLEESTGLGMDRIRAIKADVSGITTKELEAILQFVTDNLPLIRTADRAKKIIDNVSKVEFYIRELKYSKIELFIFDITRI